MPRRALSPRISAAGAAAPVISKLEGLPCGAFGSITVLIFLFLPFPRSWGARGDVLKQSKKLRREPPAVRGLSRVLRGWPGGGKVPVRRGQFCTAPAPMTGSFQTARRIHPRVLLVKSIAQHIVLVLCVYSNRAGNLTFYLNSAAGHF